MAKRASVLFPIPEGSKVEKCRTCGAPIVWITTAATAKKPSRYMPVSLRGATKNVLGEVVGESHFADCPDADKWRKKR